MNQVQNSFLSFFKNSLNAIQQSVVECKTGVLLVRAGAGSGKTRVITSRMAYLMVEHEVPAHAIIALTFTNKASKEMKERIVSFLGDRSSLPYVGTFHSYCLKLLKSNPAYVAYPNFSILDQEDQEKIVRQLLIKYGLQKKITVKQVLGTISQIKHHHTDPALFQHTDKLMQELFIAYEREKNLAKSLDFDDLLHEVLKLFRTNNSFKEKFQATVRHILVDEYQDTNKVQHALLLHMVKSLDSNEFSIDSLCVVGDEDQSIYSWRGATIENIVDFKKDFPTAQIVTIEQNYRSVQPLLKLANGIISHNKQRSPKNLFSEKPAEDRAILLTCMSGYQESEMIALFLKKAAKKNPLKNYALLYRSHYQSRSFEESFIRHAIPYKVLGGVQFYDREEIKDLLCYLRLIVNPYDRVAFSRVINCPSRGLGDKFQEYFYEIWNIHHMLSFSQVGQLILSANLLTKSKKDTLAQFLALFETLTLDDSPSAALEYIIKKTEYADYIRASYDKEIAHNKIQNIEELVNSVSFTEKRDKKTMVNFLEDIALLKEKATATEGELECVRFMTLHGAKGLEFDTVILAGLEEGIMPSAHARYDEAAIEEERRLLYVGITRSCERLICTHARYRYTYGKMTDQIPSRFIEELDRRYITSTDTTNWQNGQYEDYFTQWLDGKSEHKKKISIQPALSAAKPVQKIAESAANFRLYQTVRHASFGIGIVQKIEEKSDELTYLTIRFGTGIKKIQAQYLE